jgi:hypothetical protein
MAEDIDDIAEDSDGIAEEEADEESNPTYTYTYTFYNTSPFENHFDIYGELNMLTPNCAILTDQNDEFFAYLTVIDDVAVLITDSETKYELNYCGEDMIIQIDRTGWYEKYGSQYD